MFSFLNFLKPARPDQAFTILARRSTGDWFRSFTVPAPTSYEACRRFDESDLRDWVRVSGASLKSEFRSY
jgi:hypothetical protein